MINKLIFSLLFLAVIISSSGRAIGDDFFLTEEEIEISNDSDNQESTDETECLTWVRQRLYEYVSNQDRQELKDARKFVAYGTTLFGIGSIASLIAVPFTTQTIPDELLASIFSVGFPVIISSPCYAKALWEVLKFYASKDTIDDEIKDL